MVKNMLMMELKKIRTAKYMMSANWPAMRDMSMKTKGAAKRACLCCIPKDHATILIGLGPDVDTRGRYRAEGEMFTTYRKQSRLSCSLHKFTINV